MQPTPILARCSPFQKKDSLLCCALTKVNCQLKSRNFKLTYIVSQAKVSCHSAQYTISNNKTKGKKEEN